MRWWVAATLVYVILMSSAAAMALAPYPSPPAWGVTSNISLTLAWFNPLNLSEVIFTSQNGTALVQLGDRAYRVPVTFYSACSEGNEVFMAGSYEDRPALVVVTPEVAAASVADVNGALTTISCERGHVVGAGVEESFLSPPYRPLLIAYSPSSPSALAADTVIYNYPLSAYCYDGGCYVTDGSSYVILFNSSGAYRLEAPDYVSVYFVGQGVMAGQYVLNQSYMPFVYIMEENVTYALSTSGYVQAAARRLNTWDIFVRPPSGWSYQAFLTDSGDMDGITVALDYPYSLNYLYPFEGGFETTGTLYLPGGVQEQVGVFVNGTAEGYLSSSGQVLGWTSSSRPALTLPKLLRLPPVTVNVTSVGLEELNVSLVNVSVKRAQPLMLSRLSLQRNTYDDLVSYILDAALLATAISAFVARPPR
ncbi:MAG: hypothetical protein RXP86_00230 [Acidilobus sp.]